MNFEPMKKLMDSLTAWRIPGNSVSVYRDGKEVFNYQSGFRDLEKRLPMLGDELMYIYSCSKPLTVTAALQLYERGEFLLDDPICDFLPEFREMYINDGSGNIRKAQKQITLRHLFTMTSGLDYSFGEPLKRCAYDSTNGKMNTRAVVKVMAQKTLNFEPGERWMYGLNHDILACIVEVVSGMRFRDYVKCNIFDALGMTDSFYHKEGIEERIAPQYRFVNSDEEDIVALQKSADLRADGCIKRIDNSNGLVFGTEYDSGGAGVITTVPDYVKFCSALANFGMGTNGERILSRGAVDLLRTNQLNELQLQTFNWSQLKGYGYGLGVRTMTDKAASGTTGSLKEFGWGGAAGATVLVDADMGVAMFYAHHMLNPQEEYYQPRIRNVLYSCL